MNAPEDHWLEVPGLGDAAVTEIKLVRAAALRLMRGEVLERPVLGSHQRRGSSRAEADG
jgi:DNA repair protein RadC